MNTTVIDRNAFPGRFSFWFAAIFGTAVAVSIAGLAFRCFVIRRRGLGNISYEFGLSAIEVPASLRSDHYSLSARNAVRVPIEISVHLRRNPQRADPDLSRHFSGCPPCPQLFHHADDLLVRQLPLLRHLFSLSSSELAFHFGRKTGFRSAVSARRFRGHLIS